MICGVTPPVVNIVAQVICFIIGFQLGKNSCQPPPTCATLVYD